MESTMGGGGSTPLIMPTPMPISLIGSTSTIAIPSLDTIPGSETQTPAISDPESVPTPPPPLSTVPKSVSEHSSLHAPSEYLTPVEGPPSRRSSLAPQNGSYFPRLATSPLPSPSPSRNGTTTPLDRPRPAIEIPLGTPDEPLFSAYPDQGREPARPKFLFPLKPAFTLSQPPSRRNESSPSTSGGTSPSQGRRRANSALPAPPVPKSADRRSSKPINTPRSLKSIRRRRMSISGGEFDEGRRPVEKWPMMAAEEARRMEGHLPFSYRQPADSEYTLQSVSTIATVRPLVASPHISPRRSSLASNRLHGQLGLTTEPVERDSPEFIIPDDMVMPHDPPPRRTSLDFEMTRISFEPEAKAAEMHVDHGSVMSSSLTATDTSASLGFSTSPSSKEHPLSSATTSLSRSAKSSKEGQVSDEKDAALSAIRLQRSLEWEARQGRHRRRLEKKRMILLELVETEVAYTEDLKTLVMVYLPQIYALPSVSERTADLVARNARDLLQIHERLSGKMVDVLKEEGLGYEPYPEPDVSRQLERVSRRLAAIFVEEASSFSAYNEYCAGSIAAATLVRHIALKPEYNSYERRCQIISSAQSHSTLKDLLSQGVQTSVSVPSSPVKSNRSRLHFRDFLIMPIQRVCRYPLLLSQLLAAASTPNPDDSEQPYADETDGDYDTGVDVERALGAMRGVAEEADEARRLKESEIKSATIIERLEPHHALSPAFLKSLGHCRLVGSLDVLHHHPTVAPLVPPVRVKYMGAFLYKGYLVLAKVKKGKVYEAKHYLPLEVFDLIDITEGFLPHSIRLSLREHNFDLAASCEMEKEVWTTALCTARDESTVPPFELPASVSPFAARARRMSAAAPPDATVKTVDSTKRHTFAASPNEIDLEETSYFQVPEASPIRSSFGFTPDRARSSILLRRASATQRLQVDRGLIDVFSESCSTARSKAQLHHTLFQADRGARESSALRRRRSFLDSKQGSLDISFTGEIRGSVMPVRQTRSLAGRSREKRFSIAGNESSTEVDHKFESADETATDFGTLTHGHGQVFSRAPSFSSLSRPQSPAPPVPRHANPSLNKRKSLTNIRKSIVGDQDGLAALAHKLTLSRRKTASSFNLNQRPSTPSRAMSMPVSPIATPTTELPPSRPDEEVTVFTRGAGYTNQMPLDRQGPWSTLRRSMSFMRDPKDSDKESSSREYKDRPRISRHSTDDGFDAGASSAGMSDRTPEEDEGSHEGTLGFFDHGPRRRKSTRLFQSLSRFTPI